MFYKKFAEAFFKISENIIYLIIGILLIATAIFLVINTISNLIKYPGTDDFVIWIVTILDRTLLMLMVIEILYTVRVSFKDHLLKPEPFLIVGLIATIRRVLIISVEIAYLHEKFEPFMIEISILGGLILIFVVSIFLLRKGKTIKV